MNPLRPSPFRQALAHRIFFLGKGFAPLVCLLHHRLVSQMAALCDLICAYCYPSPFLRPGPNLVRPLFWQSAADGATSRGIGFCLAVNVVDCLPITTQRGSHPCVNHLSFSLSRHCRWPVASRAMANARWLAPALARSGRRLLAAAPTMRFWQALLVRPLAHCATTRAFAADLTGVSPTNQDHPGAAPGGLLHVWGTPCLTRS